MKHDVMSPWQLSPGSEEEEHEGPVCEKLGRIQFSVGYSFQDSTLTVKILKGQDLPAKDFSGTSDPFVKIYLLPDKKHKLETKVKRKNLNPHWNETFLFEGKKQTKNHYNILVCIVQTVQASVTPFQFQPVGKNRFRNQHLGITDCRVPFDFCQSQGLPCVLCQSDTSRWASLSSCTVCRRWQLVFSCHVWKKKKDVLLMSSRENVPYMLALM